MHTPPMEWIRGQEIGHGTFAKVTLAKPTSQNSRFPPLMAVKSCSLSHSSCLKNEFMMLNELKDCPEVVECYDQCITVENGEKLYNVALEYASGGSLFDKLKSSEGLRLLESDVRRYTKSILKGLQFIHEKQIVHCDVKLQNILLFSDDNVKIADFGLAKRAAAAVEAFMSVKPKYEEVRGTPLYMAPETVVGGEQETASDIWAVGCLVSEMLTGVPAWNCSDIGSLLMKIGVGAEIPEIPGKLSDAGKDFLGKCFIKDASERWTAEMLLKHPFIDGEDGVAIMASTSPRDPFDFPDWESEQAVAVTPCFSLESEFKDEVETRLSMVSRLRQFVTVEVPDWSDSGSWVTVR
ncbi:putative mitogen-activated protein kinase kinase kinase STE-STE11 family [Helianthus annuus]|nr:putative mitogen-activated protein kinase kinase kinase STE-STE11 family [Helianthus annuus]